MKKEYDPGKFKRSLLRRELLKHNFPKWGDEIALSEQEQMIERMDFERFTENYAKKFYGFNPVFPSAVSAVFSRRK